MCIDECCPCELLRIQSIDLIRERYVDNSRIERGKLRLSPIAIDTVLKMSQQRSFSGAATRFFVAVGPQERKPHPIVEVSYQKFFEPGYDLSTATVGENRAICARI